MPRDPREGERVIIGTRDNEDAAIVRIPGGKALVQTLDFFTPVVNDPYLFGQIAAANSLSDVYAMGGQPWTAMNILCFPVNDLPAEVLSEMLRGGADKVREAGAVLVGGHSVEDDTIKYGLSVTGIIDPDRYASNTGLRQRDVLILTKPLGTGILATAIKAAWEGSIQHERELGRWAARLNSGGGRVIRELGLQAATDVTGFGLGGHLIEMAKASDVTVALEMAALPVLPGAYELAGMGLLPAGSCANRAHFADATSVADDVDPLLVDIVFDAQTSGGLVLAVPESQVGEAVDMLQEDGESFWVIGSVRSREGDGPRLVLR